MFTVEERDQTLDKILKMARSDTRISGAALVGSSAKGSDRWSDLDLTFGVSMNSNFQEVLHGWTILIEREFKAPRLFDLVSGPSVYRVFLFPGNLQVDLSFTPEAEFGARGPDFSLLWGKSVQRTQAEIEYPEQLFGVAVHHLVRARISIEREKFWQAEYWLSGARERVLALACLQRGLSASHGRGLDNLPKDVLDEFKSSLVGSIDRESLLRSLDCMVKCLLQNSEEVQEIASRLEESLRELPLPFE